MNYFINQTRLNSHATDIYIHAHIHTQQAFVGRCVPPFISFMGKRLQRISMRSNTVPVKPQQLHYPPEGGRGKRVGECVEGGGSESGRGRTDKEGVCENKCK